MTILELATHLKALYDQHGDIDVLFSGPNHDTDPYAVQSVEVETVSPGDYPRDWNMPRKFVRLEN